MLTWYGVILCCMYDVALLCIVSCFTRSSANVDTEHMDEHIGGQTREMLREID